MGSAEDRNVALLSIHPKYVSSILSGDKQVEFRRRPFARPINLVFIYATNPIKRVVAFFTVQRINVGKPAKIWRSYRDVGGVAKEDFSSYFEGADTAVAIEIGEVQQFTIPIQLEDLPGTISPPQSYVYLSQEVFDRMMERSGTRL